MQLSIEQVLLVIGGASATVSLIFHVGLYVGKLVNRVDRHSDTLSDHGKRLDGHDGKIEEHDDEFRFIKGIGK